MSEVKTMDFIDEVYREMKENDFVMSLPNAKIKYKSMYNDEISEDYIKSILLDDGRFVFVNNTQFLLKTTLEEIILKTQYNIIQIEKYLQENYFIKDISRKDLMSIININRNTFSIEYEDKIYEINSIDDFYELVKEKGFTTYDVIKDTANQFNIDYYYLLYEINNLGVNVDKNSKFRENCNVLNRNKILEEEIIETKKENILLTDLRSNELVACFLALSYFNQIYQKEYIGFFSNRHLNGLYKMSIINEQYKEGKLVFTNCGKKIIENCKRYLSNYYYKDYVVNEIIKSNNSKQLAKSKVVKEINDSKLWSMISKPIKEIYVNNYYSKLLIDLIAECNRISIFNLGDIILFHLRNGKRKVIREIFVGDKASSGIKPIRNNKDICLHCEVNRCSNRGNITKEKLLYYRTSYVNSFIKSVSEDISNLDLLFEDPLIIKFIVPYNLTSKNKIIMKYVQLLSNNINILQKKDGTYCPFEDIWILKEIKND